MVNSFKENNTDIILKTDKTNNSINLLDEALNNIDQLFAEVLPSPKHNNIDLSPTASNLTGSINSTILESNLTYETSTTSIETNNLPSEDFELEFYKISPGKVFSDFATPRSHINGNFNADTHNALNSLILYSQNESLDKLNNSNENMQILTAEPSKIFFTPEDIFSDQSNENLDQTNTVNFDTSKLIDNTSSINANKIIHKTCISNKKIIKPKKSSLKNQSQSMKRNCEFILGSDSIFNLETSTVPFPNVKLQESIIPDGINDRELSIFIKNKDTNNREYKQKDNKTREKNYNSDIDIDIGNVSNNNNANSFPDNLNQLNKYNEAFSDNNCKEIASNCLPSVFESVDDLVKIEHCKHRCNGCFKVSNSSYGCSRQLIKKLPNLEAYKEYNTPNGYSLEYSKKHGDPQYIYLDSEVKTSYDPLVKRYLNGVQYSPKGKKLKRDYPSLCPFCKVSEGRKFDSLFYERNNSCYRGHLINTHGINSTGEVALLPQSGFVCYKLGKNTWSESIGFKCPYEYCNVCFIKGDKTHGFHEYIRHWNRYHID
jgi:hypothetical protein